MAEVEDVVGEVMANANPSESALQPFLLPTGRPSLEALQRLASAGKVLEEKEILDAPLTVPKVVLAEGAGGPLIVKVWYPDRLFTSARLYPYSTRFRRHAAQLRNLGFSAPLVRGWGYLREIKAHYVSYDALPGRSLRELKPEVDFTSLAAFVTRLHKAGVDYRSLHLGNILWQGGAAYSLIDLTDCSFRSRPLSLKAGTKRLVYLCSHRQDLAFMREADHWADLLLAYGKAMHVTAPALLRAARAHKGWSEIAPADESASVWTRFAAL